MSKNNSFFKPTLLFIKFMILDIIEKNARITQREIAATIGVAVSMVNGYLDDYEEKKLIRRKKINSKIVKYYITKQGMEQKKLLNIKYFSESLIVFKRANENLRTFLEGIVKKGFIKILLYGAGEVAEILIQSIMTSDDLNLEVIGVIDDDKNKEGKFLLNTEIINLESIKRLDFDGILISSYINSNIMIYNLLNNGVNLESIITFFH